MTRRKFISRLMKTGSAVIASTWFLARKSVPRKFIRAKVGRFPGSLKPLRGIYKQSKWSG